MNTFSIIKLLITSMLFIHPSSKRLTDEEWKEILASNNKPEIPIWCESFFSSEVKPGKIGFQDKFNAYRDRYHYTFEPD